ncbi:hypothetical protein LPJ78_005882 [Coemansia sp. RSA 989]|nr:Rdx family-domain-containing protein [Coemansia mojavensis]KAJ1737999.1 hypothetical protein LPJ68_005907 [Coemansia sp. RSA 1086]KAJ1746424.1 hypothetical protein LPJ79_005878 [Coemansia sp. RSA 1821]KAJ1860295.1 hypothetical protein LPJ78_005882 [Coemansia sp. RSA 989]KAJ1866428.1 hypothetical protein LPJ55_006015 [Coemansia sp. RSA 990]KAJ2626370.1 hypothetical protein H4R22_004836 [Coemansia sp. RSA 1290]KAJ2645539.1 hypothetical protein IWW40_005957 [Coemansia sp. RSA 1250]KAJ2669853
MKPRVEIHYCTQCRWLLRAGWTAQELLTTFSDTLGEVALVPQKGGVFAIYVDSELVFDRKAEGRFPEMKEVKQLVRNRVSPSMDLGHSDTPVKSRDTKTADPVDAEACPNE